jgi:hypothetical protein
MADDTTSATQSWHAGGWWHKRQHPGRVLPVAAVTMQRGALLPSTVPKALQNTASTGWGRGTGRGTMPWQDGAVSSDPDGEMAWVPGQMVR